MRFPTLFLASLLVLPSSARAQAASATPAATPVTDARDVFARGFILQDRNGDDVADFVNVRIVLPTSPMAAEIAAAANVAARMGYETSAMDLGLVSFDSGAGAGYESPVIVVGSRNTLASRLGGWGGALAASEGAISFVGAGGFFRAGAVSLVGGDATGLGAAADYMSGRYPSVWGMRGDSLGEVTERIGRFATQREAVVQATTLDRIVVDAMRPGVSRALITMRVADTASFRRVVDGLREARDTTGGSGAARGGGAGAGRRAGADTAGARGGVVTSGAAGDSATTGSAQAADRPVRRADLDVQDLHRIDVRIISPTDTTIVRLLPARPWQTRAATEFASRETPDFTLSDLYTIRGLFRDTNQDLVPDRTEAYLSLEGELSAGGAVDLAARVGLETAGMRLPFARAAGQDDHPETRGFPILYGVGHYRTDRLREAGELHAGGDVAGEGSIEQVRRVLDGRSGLIITGGDAEGLEAIAGYTSHRMPYLWEYGKGNYRLSDVETEVRRFFQAVETPGQIALAGYKLGTWLDRLAGRAIDSVAIEIATEQPPAGLDHWAAALASQRFPAASVGAATFRTGFGQGDTIFTQDFDIPWEVDEFRTAFRDEVLPALSASSRGRLEVRLSEPPAVREALAREIRGALDAKGIPAANFGVVVLSAYKQGYSWLNDVVLPRLQTLLAAGPTNGEGDETSGSDGSARAVGRIEITYHTLRDSDEVRWQEVESDTRWLQEIYPIDAVLARDLGIADSLITFTATQRAAPIYAVRVLDNSGAEIMSDTFDPKYVVRPYFDLFPEYEKLRVTTGWLNVEIDGRALIDRRIQTDPERFWDVLQNDTYARIIDYVMDIQDGRPSPGNAPYYDEFRIELSMSEPNYRIGIDEDVISSLEALHEDIYFETLQLFDLIGDRYGVGALSYAGRVLPYISVGGDGRPGHARITFTGKERGVPELVMTYRERGGEPVRERYPISGLNVAVPMLRGIAVRSGDDGVQRLHFEVAAIDSIDTYAENRLRGTESAVDRQLLPVELLSGMVGALADMHNNGVAEDALSFDRVAELSFRFILGDTTQTFSRMTTLPRSRRPRSTVNPRLIADSFRPAGQRLVQWETPIPPAESDSILARLGTFPGVNVHFITKSFLGQNVWAADFLPPQEAAFVSQAKLNALKPTLFLSGRQHANEVSSTSHLLRLGELLVTDSAHRELLKKVNVVLHPITNPDGARLAYEMQLINPDFMLHAGYLGALGVDATAGGNGADPIYPESVARPELQAMWLPDIYMNMHGYPSHEWVQYFAGYSAWVRGRTGTQRSWWAPRGWFVPGFSYTEDTRYPEFQQAQFAILDSIAGAITAQPAVEAMNRRMYARYAKYGQQDRDNFREYFRNGILVYQSLRGRPVGGTGPNSTRVNYFSLTTEAPDETARGDWLELVATAGLAHSSALLRYLAGGQNRIERETAEYSEFVTRNVFRKKPVLPPADSVSGNAGGGG